MKTAELALKGGDHDSCVSRCYYAMFFMAEAILLTKNLKASSHKGVITLFGEHFLKTEVFGKELGKALRRAYDLRQKGDYATEFLVSKEEAEDGLEKAKTFVTKIEEYLKINRENKIS